MERTLYSLKAACHGGCQYCFAQWNEYAPRFQPPSSELLINRTKKHVIYPCCDGDFVVCDSFFESMEQLSMRRNIIISISTKQSLSDDALASLKHIHKNLQINGGFLKVGISITTKSMIKTIEPGTSSYQKRIETLNRLATSGIPTAVTIKPMLPFISLEEYRNIIDDTAFVGQYVTGSLYVCPNTEFFKKYIYEKQPYSLRKVNWISDECEWLYVSQDERIEQLHNYIEGRNLQVFSSDLYLIESIASSQTI